MPPSIPALVPTDELPPEALHAAFVHAFADYVAGPFQLDLAQWPGFLTRQGIDLSLGRAAIDPASGAVLAFALVAPRTALGRWRLGTMGAVPEARGSGAARGLLVDLQARARASGVAALELEVFAQNPRARRLYQQLGFVEQHPLRAHRCVVPPGDAVPLPAAWACPSEEALAWLRETEAMRPDLPLQVSAPVVQALTVPWTTWRRGTAQLIVSGDAAAGLVVRSLIDRDPAQADAEALVRALLAAHPGATVTVPALQRPDLGGEALERCGFEREALGQWLMRCDLRGPALREERSGDEAPITALHEAAFRDHPFSQQTEGRIVQALRAAGALSLSLVAFDLATDELLGHVAFSPVSIEGQPAQARWFGLGPLAVRPDRQRAGIGAALVRAGLQRLRAMDAAGCVVLGDPAYYGRFGFAARPGWVLPGVPDGPFQVMSFTRVVPSGGVARYHPGFDSP